jgi:hypothetical protein
MNDEEHRLQTHTNTLHIAQIIDRMDSYKNDLSQQIDKSADTVMDKMTIAFRTEAQILADGLNKRIDSNKDRIIKTEGQMKYYAGGAMGIGVVLSKFWDKIFGA